MTPYELNQRIRHYARNHWAVYLLLIAVAAYSRHTLMKMQAEYLAEALQVGTPPQCTCAERNAPKKLPEEVAGLLDRTRATGRLSMEDLQDYCDLGFDPPFHPADVSRGEVTHNQVVEWLVRETRPE